MWDPIGSILEGLREKSKVWDPCSEETRKAKKGQSLIFRGGWGKGMEVSLAIQGELVGGGGEEKAKVFDLGEAELDFSRRNPCIPWNL